MRPDLVGRPLRHLPAPGFTGVVQVKQVFHLPADVSTGEYELLLNLPDGYKTLQDNPAYSIRLANEDLWEAATGFNKLKDTLQVRSATVK